MIADFARVANGKLDVIGGGWSTMQTGMIGPRVTRPRSPLPVAPEAAPAETVTAAVSSKRKCLMTE